MEKLTEQVSFAKLKNGTYQILVIAPYFLGDEVEYNSPQPDRDRKGKGKIAGLTIYGGELLFEVAVEVEESMTEATIHVIEAGIVESELRLIGSRLGSE